MKHSIENKIILVTGASRGIGYATALKLAEYGAQLILASRNLSDLEDIREKILSEYKYQLNNGYGDRSKLLPYFIKHQLKQLTEVIHEF